MMAADKILEFWEQQAALAEKSGSKDLLAKELEVAALSRRVGDGLVVCGFGCAMAQPRFSLPTAST